MGKWILDQLGGVLTVRKLISSFYDKVLDTDELVEILKEVNMEKLLDRSLEELQYYVENGKAHERTLKA